jgi:hypothetical protein
VPDRPDLFNDLFGFPDDEFPGMPRHNGARHNDARSRHPMPCPPLGILLAYADEDDTSLTPRRRQRIREHVHHCETCFSHVERAFREELSGIVEMLKADYDFNQSVGRRRESRFQEALHTQIKRKAPPLGSHHRLTQRLTIAATLALIAVGLMLLRPGAVVIHAEELIERAMAYEREHPGESRRVRQTLAAPAIAMGLGLGASGVPRAAPFSAIREVVDGAFSAEMRLVNVREREAHAELARLFEAHRFDWRKPFCLTCYRAWRASLSRKRDTVTVTGDMYLLRTTTSEGSLREMTLAFDRDSYRLVRQTFLFEGLGRIAIEELERRAAPIAPPAPANQRASAASRAAVDSGAGTLAPPVSSRPPAAGDLARGTSRTPLSRWLDRTFPPSAAVARSTFLPEVERRSSSVRQHLIVLQRLANVSGRERLKNATDGDRANLRQQVELEYQAVVTHLNALEERMNLLLGTGTRSMELRTPVPADWQRRASTALPHATRLEHRLRRIFTHDDLPLEETQKFRPRSARAAFEALWESIHGNQREGASAWVPN